jgi:hypothetical protein
MPEFSTAITHLRDVLGNQTYESFARKYRRDTRIWPTRVGRILEWV